MTQNGSIICFLADTPGPVDGPIRFTGITAEKCTVWWNPPENDGCAAITHYVVEKRETSRISWALVTSKCEACSYNATSLIKGNEYQFRISAVNKFGVGKPLDSDPITAKMQYSESSLSTFVCLSLKTCLIAFKHSALESASHSKYYFYKKK